jgi:hypothetical protein
VCVYGVCACALAYVLLQSSLMRSISQTLGDNTTKKAAVDKAWQALQSLGVKDNKCVVVW